MKYRKTGIVFVFLSVLGILCSCSVKSKSALISYARHEFGPCTYISQDVSGQGNDMVRTVWLKDKETGIEYEVRSGMTSIDVDGSVFGYTENTSSNFLSLYIDYIFDEASDDLDEVCSSRGAEIYYSYGSYIIDLDARPQGNMAEDTARSLRDIICSYDDRSLIDFPYLVYADDESVYLGVLTEDEWTANNPYSVIDEVSKILPDAEYTGSIYGIAESYVDPDTMDRLRELGAADNNTFDTEFFFFNDPVYGSVVAFDLSQIGLSGILINEYDAYSGDTIYCELLDIYL